MLSCRSKLGWCNVRKRTQRRQESTAARRWCLINSLELIRWLSRVFFKCAMALKPHFQLERNATMGRLGLRWSRGAVELECSGVSLTVCTKLFGISPILAKKFFRNKVYLYEWLPRGLMWWDSFTWRWQHEDQGRRLKIPRHRDKTAARSVSFFRYRRTRPYKFYRNHFYQVFINCSIAAGFTQYFHYSLAIDLDYRFTWILYFEWHPRVMRTADKPEVDGDVDTVNYEIALAVCVTELVCSLHQQVRRFHANFLQIVERSTH